MHPDGESAGQITVRVQEFEGPLDLLLHLIRRDKIDLYDIPMSEITHQYLSYLETMRQLNLEIASEFLVMAATLILIKSKMLLPVPPAEAEEEEEDPRAELVQRLLEYQAVRDAAGILKERVEREEQFLRREIPPPAEVLGEEVLELSVSLFALMDAFRGLLARVEERGEEMTIYGEALSVTERMGQILAMLPEKKRLALEGLFTEPPTRGMVVVTFLAILELLHRQVVKAYQSQLFGPIYLKRVEGEE